jgi:hypothetical protein
MKKIICLISITYLIINTVIINTTNGQCFSCQDAPSGTIFCDDFEDNTPLDKKYFEVNNNSGDFIRMEQAGRDNTYGMRVKWQKGEVAAGGLSKSFGKTPDTYIGKNAAHPTENFDEIYWRMDVKSQLGWTGGGPAKLSRAMCLANSNWAQGMMAHIWSGNNNNLGMDPASGIGVDGKLKSTKYNDFNNLRWLGWKPGNIDLYSNANSGKWYCIVAHAKLNTPGLKDGVFEFWINDTLQASSNNLDWHSTWNNDPNNLHINAIFFENYWNDGSPVEQERYFDNLVISTNPIPCSCKVTKVENEEFNRDIKILQNPIIDNLAIEVPENLLPIKISIYDINAKMFSQQNILKSKTIIDMSRSPSGFYFLNAAGINPIKFYKE